MIDPDDYAAQFGDLPVPAALQTLLRFQNEVGYGNYSEALTLSKEGRAGLRHGWSADPEFLARLVPFARATASGSFYALWNPDPSQPPMPDRWPVVVFGDEGGEWIVARDVRELLRVSTCDVEPCIDLDRVHFHRDEHRYRKTPGLDGYVEWLRERFQIAPVDDPEEILKAAQGEWQVAFERWANPILERG
ncbi:hypothetical protein CDN99_05440 [Roseateles aquatilis]|uniref:Uncharacterized protein n=1 Tax=Roseateles aquatilis TaxID=431061 RepID=A0A246JMM3_9BURK|nr:hypothetical protein [Roseateles aquatilis]OWQ93871.1 hypothetical protein CDN99_05440 [Roseateles aquatilis]